MVMTYKEWLNEEYPYHRVLNKPEEFTALGNEYRQWVEKITGLSAIEYHQMSNDKGFASWLRNIMHQRSVGKMKDTYRNSFILWNIYKKSVKARLVKFIDDEGFMRDIEQPREIYYDEATKIDPEVLDSVQDRIRSTWLHPQGTFTKAIREHDPIIPDHYGGKDDPYEAIKVINAWGLGFCLGNVLKYIKRTGKKGDPVEDLKKAQRYLELEIEKYDIHG